MSKKHIHIGVEDSAAGYRRFVDAWERAESGNLKSAEMHLNFADLSTLLALLTPRRMELLKTLRQSGPSSIRALAHTLGRNYKNVHTDCNELENAGLIERTEGGQIQAPWDVIDAHISLVA